MTGRTPENMMVMLVIFGADDDDDVLVMTPQALPAAMVGRVQRRSARPDGVSTFLPSSSSSSSWSHYQNLQW